MIKYIFMFLNYINIVICKYKFNIILYININIVFAYTYGKSQKKLGIDSMQTDFCIWSLRCLRISLWVLKILSLDNKSVFARSFFLTKQKWHRRFELEDLYIKQKLAASGQSAIMVETLG